LGIYEKRSLITILDGNIPRMGDIRRIKGWGKGMEFIRSRFFITSLRDGLAGDGDNGRGISDTDLG